MGSSPVHPASFKNADLSRGRRFALLISNLSHFSRVLLCLGWVLELTEVPLRAVHFCRRKDFAELWGFRAFLNWFAMAANGGGDVRGTLPPDDSRFG